MAILRKIVLKYAGMKTHPDLGGLFSAILLAFQSNRSHFIRFYFAGKIRAFYGLFRRPDPGIRGRYGPGFQVNLWGGRGRPPGGSGKEIYDGRVSHVLSLCGRIDDYLLQIERLKIIFFEYFRKSCRVYEKDQENSFDF